MHKTQEALGSLLSLPPFVIESGVVARPPEHFPRMHKVLGSRSIAETGCGGSSATAMKAGAEISTVSLTPQ